MLDRAQDHRVRQRDASVRHHDPQVSHAQLESREPAATQDDDLSVEMPSLEQCFDRTEGSHCVIFARSACLRQNLKDLADARKCRGPLPSGRPQQLHLCKDQAKGEMPFPNDRRHTLGIILKDATLQKAVPEGYWRTPRMLDTAVQSPRKRQPTSEQTTPYHRPQRSNP